MMNVLSLFDGMSCGRLALDRAGVAVNKYYSSEIKTYAIDVANENFPQDKDFRLGDITKIKGDDLPVIDLLIGGSPCQDFSGANKGERLGLAGVKSGLFFEYIRLLREVKPTFFLLENVRMKKNHQDFISSLLGCEPIVINSKLLAPHLRHRLYWTNIPFNGQPVNSGLLLNDCIDGYSDRDKARTLLESDSRPLANSLKMCHRYFNTGFTTLIFKSKIHFDEIKTHFDANFKGKSAKEIDVLSAGMDLSLYNGVRYMNNNEREACQTVPIGFTDSLKQNKAACLLGDGWTVDVIAHIFKGLK